MPMAFEADLVGKRESWADIISCLEAEATPYSSMVEKRKRPAQVLHSWQVKAYPKTGHRGVIDGQDASGFQSNPRKQVQVRAQKTWYKPGVSDFADEADIVALGQGEMPEQIADALVTVKRQIEKRCLSNDDTAEDNGTTRGNETRGAFCYISATAQGTLPIADGFRTPAAQIHADTLANFTEETFLAQCRSSFKQRKGPFKLHGFVGIDLKAEFTNFSKYVDTVSNTAIVRTFNQDAKGKALVNTIDKLVLDTGEVDLLPTSFLYTDADTGDDTAYTHKSGIFVDLNMCALAYSRLPRVVRLPYGGGGQKAIVDAIFLHMMDNVLGSMAVKASA